MIRVGFALSLSATSWLGGVNYIRNLLAAIQALPVREIEPVLITGRHPAPEWFRDFPPVEIIHTSFLDKWDPRWAVRKVCRHLSDRDIFLTRIMAKHRIAAISHSPYLGGNIPALGWIPDFQHKYYPEFFSRRELPARERDYQLLCRDCAGILVSSRAAQHDLHKFYPDWRGKSRVLQFVTPLAPAREPVKPELLEDLYQFRGPFFFVPNQFWIHKNHLVIVQALQILKARGQQVQVLATGSTYDYRHKNYFQDLMSQVQDAGLLDSFRVLGVVPYAHLQVLMAQAVALINPSLSEGWSTTVEEGKSLGKQTLLSDIPVHREQNPDRAIFFPPHEALTLAEAMWHLWTSYDPEVERRFREKAAQAAPIRWREFGEQYQRIVCELIGA